MKMKNSKVMLALFVVAALAMVSVAGAAFAAEKADAKILTPVQFLTIDKDSTDWYGVYTTTTTTAIVKEDAKYTGQVHFGSYDTSAKIFKSKVILEFTDVNNLVIAYDASHDRAVVISGDTAGTINVLQGTVALGDTEGNFFNGKVSGKTATVDVTNAYDLVFKADTVDVISGYVAQGNKQLPDEDGVLQTVPAVVKLGGNAVLGDGLTVSDGKFIIAEGATLTGDGNAKAYAFKIGDEIEVQVGSASLTAVDGMIYDSDDVVYATHLTEKKFTLLRDMPINGKYGVMMAGYESETFRLYFGNLSFTSTATTTEMTVKANLTSSKSVSVLSADELTPYGASGFTFDTAKYKCLIANVGGTSVGNYWNTEGTVTFQNSITGKLLVVMMDKATGGFLAYNGTASTVSHVVDFGTSATTLRYSVSATEAAANIYFKPTTWPTVSLASKRIDETCFISVEDGAVMDVNGNLVLGYTDNLSNAAVSNSGTINVSGMIEYNLAVGASAPLNCETGIINAACYNVSTLTKNTYFYTTLEKAMTESDAISVYGTHKLLKDMTLTGKSNTSNNITVENNSTLEIGQAVDEKNKPAPITAIVTVPKTTTFVTEAGVAEVINGQLKIEDETDDRITGIIANVFYVSAPYGIYTDLVTALENAKSGDTVTVRADSPAITISRNAEVKEGVTLDATALGANDLIVDSGVVFTMSGKMTVNNVLVKPAVSGDEPKAAGKLILKSVEMNVIVKLKLQGDLEFAASFDNTTEANAEKFDVTVIEIDATSDEAPAIIKIEGKLAYGLGDITGRLQDPDVVDYVKFIVPGTAKLKAPTSGPVRLYTIFEVTGTVAFAKNLGGSAPIVNVVVNEIYATGKAKVVPAADGTVYVFNKAVFGTASNTLTQSVNEVEAKVTLVYNSGDSYNAVATVYGDAAKVFVKSINSANLSDLTVKKTQFLIKVNQQDTVLYMTNYAAYEGSSMNPLPVVKVTGYKQMSSWYMDFECTSYVAAAECGEYVKLYTNAEKLKFTITLEAQTGVKWRVDGIERVGDVVVEYGEHRVSIAAEKGYDVSKVTISKDGSAYTADSRFSLADNAVFKATAPAATEDKSSLGLIEILLIIITIVIVIMVIIIAMKLMRS